MLEEVKIALLLSVCNDSSHKVEQCTLYIFGLCRASTISIHLRLILRSRNQARMRWRGVIEIYEKATGSVLLNEARGIGSTV